MVVPDAPRSARVLLRVLFLGALGTCALTLAFFWQRAHDKSREAGCRGNLFCIGSLLRAYHAKHSTYPPSSEELAGTVPLASWRVTIIAPDLKGYDFQQAWNSPHNWGFRTHSGGRLFSCPSDPGAQETGETAYLAVAGNGTLWSEVRLGRIRNPEKEAPNKILVIEVPRSRIRWTEPCDISVADAIAMFRQQKELKPSGHVQGLHYLAGDGNVRRLDEVGSSEEFAGLLRAAD